MTATAGNQCRRKGGAGGRRCDLLGTGGLEGGPGPACVTYVLSFSLVLLLSTVRINLFRPRPSHSAAESEQASFVAQQYKCLV
jgi:hypothetical protein